MAKDWKINRGNQTVKLIIPLTIYILWICFANQANASDYIIMEVATKDELNEYNKLAYEKRIKDWESLPEKYEKFQAVQIVKYNSYYNSYETMLISLGKIGRSSCLKEISNIINEYGKGTYAR